MPKETEEERAARKERERRERPKETEEERAARKERERKERPKETEEERAARKERERKEGRSDRPKETEEERAARKERERKEGRDRPRETEEERAARKERERKEGRSERPKETEEERAARKERERKEGRPKETEEERAARKERERKEGRKETEEERAARKERERKEGKDKPRETEEERAARKERERKEGRSERPKETEEERRIRKDRERAEREEKDRQKAAQPVVHKALPTTLEQQQKQQQQAKGSSSSQKPADKPVMAAPSKPVMAAPAKTDDDDGDDDDGYGDDDFEEQLSPAEMAAIAAATEQENKEAEKRKREAARAAESGAGSGTSPARGKYDVDPSVQGHSRAGLDMNSLERQKAKKQYEKDTVRADALRRLVDLDGLTATVYDLPPQSEYDMFIRNFGGVVRQQTAVQAPAEEDMIDVEAQAERIHSKIKACQCPEDLGLFPERKHVDPNHAAAQADGAGGRDEKEENKEESRAVAATRVDTVALGAFLQRSFPVIRTLMDENEATRNPLTKKMSFNATQFSSTTVPLLFEPCAGRPVIDVVFSRFATQYMLVIYGPPKDGVEDTTAGLGAYNGVALLWNVNDNREPDKILVSHNVLTSGCLSASRPYLVYAGSASGSVSVWDTREPEHLHADNSSTRGIAPRIPSYATDWGKDNHNSPVVKCVVAGYNSIMGVRKEEAEQLVSIDKKGSVFFWRVNDDDAAKKQAQTISDSEYGLNLFSSVQLHRTSAIEVAKGTSSSCTDVEFVPSDVSHLLVASSRQIEHVSKFGSITAPSAYRAQSQWGSTTPASAVHYSPTDSRILVGGFRDGSVRLFLKDDPTPQVTVPLQGAKDLARIRCSTSMKWVVFALDSDGTLSVIDFACANKTTPIAKSDLQEAKAGRCTSFDVSNEEKAETRLGVGYENGLVEVHTLNQKIFGKKEERNERWL